MFVLWHPSLTAINLSYTFPNLTFGRSKANQPQTLVFTVFWQDQHADMAVILRDHFWCRRRCVALMLQKRLMQDDREQMEHFTNTVKFLMVVESMKENGATAEVPGLGTSGTCSWAKTNWRAFLLHGERVTGLPHVQDALKEAGKNLNSVFWCYKDMCRLEAVRWVHRVQKVDDKDELVQVASE